MVRKLARDPAGVGVGIGEIGGVGETVIAVVPALVAGLAWAFALLKLKAKSEKLKTIKRKRKKAAVNFLL